jgi:hypothetical protein
VLTAIRILPSGGHEVGSVAITDSDQVR